MAFRISKSDKIKGFTLLELLVYVAIFGVVVMVVASMLVVILNSKDGADAQFEVAQNLRFASEKVRQLVYDAASSSVSGTCPLNTLEVTIAGVTTTVAIASGVFRTTSQGVTDDLTSGLVTASTDASCLFTRIANASPAKPTLQLQFKISYNDHGDSQLQFFDSVKTTISQR